MAKPSKTVRAPKGGRNAITGKIVLTPASKPKNITLQQARRAVREAAAAKA